MRLPTMSLSGVAMLLLIVGCHQAKAPQASAQDIEAAKQEAQHEVDEARKEASKDVKSAVKTMGSDSKGVVNAKITGKYDVAMAQADGDHKVATEKCLTLQADMQKACKDQADADYETAAAAAKALRLAKQQ
jgi:hypothetical protein